MKRNRKAFLFIAILFVFAALCFGGCSKTGEAKGSDDVAADQALSVTESVSDTAGDKAETPETPQTPEAQEIEGSGEESPAEEPAVPAEEAADPSGQEGTLSDGDNSQEDWESEDDSFVVEDYVIELEEDEVFEVG